MGNVIEPVVQGQRTGLSPLAIVLSAAFWTLLWGPIGLLLAIPLTVVLVVLGRHVERLEFLHVLLGDTPAAVAARAILSAHARRRSGRARRAGREVHQ